MNLLYLEHSFCRLWTFLDWHGLKSAFVSLAIRAIKSLLCINFQMPSFWPPKYLTFFEFFVQDPFWCALIQYAVLNDCYKGCNLPSLDVPYVKVWVFLTINIFIIIIICMMYKRAGIKTKRFEWYGVKKNVLCFKASSVDLVLNLCRLHRLNEIPCKSYGRERFLWQSNYLFVIPKDI